MTELDRKESRNLLADPGAYEQEQAAARPDYERLAAAVRRVVARLGEAGTVAEAAVERAAHEIEVPGLSTGLLGLALEAHEMKPLERLVLALACRRALAASDHETDWKAAFANAACDAIFELATAPLYATGLRLLDELIAARPDWLSRALLHFRRACARIELAPGDPTATNLAFGDLLLAADLALAEGRPDRCAMATAAFAKLVARTVPSDAEVEAERRREVGHSLLEAAMQLPLSDVDRALLHQARAHLIRTRSPKEAVTAFEEALSLLSDDDPFWTEVAAELVTTLVRDRQFRSAAERGTDFVARASCATDRTELGMLHCAVGEALAASGRAADARGHLETALALARGRHLHNEALARIYLVHVGLALRDRTMAEEQLRLLQDSRGRLDAMLQRDIRLVEAECAGAWGQTDARRAALQATLSLTQNEEARTKLALELALADLAAGRGGEALDALVAKAITLSADSGVEGLVIDLVCRHGAALTQPTRAAVRHWAEARGRPSVVARLHQLAGEATQARSLLGRALASDLTDIERLACMHQLVTVLAPADVEERRQVCDEIERLMEETGDEPYVRLDLAAALRLDAEGNPDVLWRAWRHGQRGLASVREPLAAQHAVRTLGGTVVDLLHASLPESSPAQAELASWLIEPHDLPCHELAQLRLAAAQGLLLVGPIVHPQALAAARRLTELARSCADVSGDVSALAGRLAWIEQRRNGQGPAEWVGPPPPGPFDRLPSWLVAAIAADPPLRVSAGQLGGHGAELTAALRVRPDVADRVLAALLPLQHELAPSARQDFLGAVHDSVQLLLVSRDDAWSELCRALAAIPSGKRHPMLATIESATRRVTGAAPEPIRGLPAGADVQGSLPEAPTGARQRARACFQRGVELLESLQRDPHAADALARIEESRSLLDEAVRLAKKKKMRERFDFLVSLGNAWKAQPGANVDKALGIYEMAAKVDAVPEQRAKLWKVEADALRERGRPDDIRRAEKLLERSLKVRRGWLRAETLFSAAQVALAHPDLAAHEREVRAAEHLMNAVRAHPDHAQQILPILLNRLAAWHRLLPDDPRPARLREELGTIYPSRAEEIAEPYVGPSEREIETAVRSSSHPAATAFMEVRMRLMTVAERNFDALPIAAAFGPSLKMALEEQAVQRSLLDQPDEAEAVLAALTDRQQGPELPGVLAAKVVLLAFLARRGRHRVDEVRNATKLAVAALASVDDHLVQATLLREMAAVWSPNNTVDDPVRDFEWAASLARQCVALEGGEGRALNDSLALLARSLRYAPGSVGRGHLVEARRLYRLLLDRAPEAIGPEQRANVIHNLAEVENQMAEGSRLQRLERAESSLEQSVASANSPFRKAESLANLAWWQTQIGIRFGGADGRAYLERALRTFDRVDLRHIDPAVRGDIEGNRTACEAALAQVTRGRDAAIAIWRNRLGTLDPATAPHRAATAKHNLANALLIGEDVTAAQFTEGLRLCGEAIASRTMAVDARHHWETALVAGAAILRGLQAGWTERLPMSPREAWQDSRQWLRQAVAAARTLGPGQELADTAFALCELSVESISTAEAIDLAEEGWTAVRDASAFVLVDGESLEREARTALVVASSLAHRLAETALPVASPGVAFVLHGESARLVQRWLLRAQHPARRPLRARLARPKGVSAGTWLRWQEALRSGDTAKMADLLHQIHEAAPGFPAETEHEGPTWRWLEGRPGSVGIALFVAEPVWLAMLLDVDDSGRRTTWILGLDVPRPPFMSKAVEDFMWGAAHGNTGGETHDTLAAWIRERALVPLVRFLGRQPTVVLWSPGPGLRTVAPAALWRGVPVASTASIALQDHSTSPGRPRSTLVVLADPGSREADGDLDLGPHGTESFHRLAAAAAERGPVRQVASVGPRYGRQLLGNEATVRDTPASATDLLAEASEHDVIVVIAHAKVETVENAALLCLDASGRIERLDVDSLARNPDRFAGSLVLLLSCAGGRVGSSLADPGGVAGTLVSAGARCVVAPLWPVRLDVATEVGEAVLRGLAACREPWDVLATLQVPANGSAPLLGGPPPPLSDREAADSGQRLAFATWVG